MQPLRLEDSRKIEFSISVFMELEELLRCLGVCRARFRHVWDDSELICFFGFFGFIGIFAMILQLSEVSVDFGWFWGWFEVLGAGWLLVVWIESSSLEKFDFWARKSSFSLFRFILTVLLANSLLFFLISASEPSSCLSCLSLTIMCSF